MKGLFMDADVTAILAAIDVVSKKVDSAKDELKEDIQNVQETVDKHTSSLQHIVRVVAGPMPVAINNIEKKLGIAKTDFPLRSVPAEISG
jgi:uncharacterized protein YaaN involved in tellurite resistance